MSIHSHKFALVLCGHSFVLKSLDATCLLAYPVAARFSRSKSHPLRPIRHTWMSSLLCIAIFSSLPFGVSYVQTLELSCDLCCCFFSLMAFMCRTPPLKGSLYVVVCSFNTLDGTHPRKPNHSI